MTCARREATCDACKSRFTTAQPKARFCLACRDGNRVGARRALYVPKTLSCMECKAPFVTSYGDKRSHFCSIGCSRRNSRRVHRAIVRAREHGVLVEAINPFQVLERDGWRCRQCGVDTPFALRGTSDDAAPEVDHVVPLSLGGEHTYQNTQCLCRKCNLSKGSVEPNQRAPRAGGWQAS